MRTGARRSGWRCRGRDGTGQGVRPRADEGRGQRDARPESEYFMVYRVLRYDTVGFDDERARVDRGRPEENTATFCNLELETGRAPSNSTGHVVQALEQREAALSYTIRRRGSLRYVPGVFDERLRGLLHVLTRQALADSSARSFDRSLVCRFADLLTRHNARTPGLVDEKWETGESTLSFCVVGASGDLAKKKILPALFALYNQGMMPKQFSIFGYARSKLTQDEFRELVKKCV